MLTKKNGEGMGGEGERGDNLLQFQCFIDSPKDLLEVIDVYDLQLGMRVLNIVTAGGDAGEGDRCIKESSKETIQW